MSAAAAVQKERLIETFMSLVRVDSPSGQEAALSDALAAEFKELGCSVYQDDIGNLIATFPGSRQGAETVMLCAHMDTVGTDVDIQPIRQADRITSDGTTILGADDKSGIAVILEIIKVFRDNPEIVHPTIEAVITVQEEIGVVGSTHLQKDRLKSSWGLVLDGGGPIGSITVSGPTSRKYTFTVHGKAAHAAIAPEEGVNAIQAAAAGIAACPCGKVDPEVVSGIGVIQGGVATNIVPDLVTVQAMIRSRNDEKLESWSQKMEKAFQDGCDAFGAQLTIEKHDSYFGYLLDESSLPWQKSKAAALQLGFPFSTHDSLGGTDCNNFNRAGIPSCAVSTGMANEHMKNEYILIQDLVDSARWVITAITI
jgi:tripeptide aminopeptidase